MSIKVSELRKLVQMLESETGKKVKFTEVKKKRALKEADEATLNGAVDGLTKLSSTIWGLKSNQITKQTQSFIGSKVDEIIQKLTETNADTQMMGEDVSMTIDQAEKDPDAIKKFGDKDIDVKLTDEDGDDKSAVII
jgi:hypothetical protein